MVQRIAGKLLEAHFGPGVMPETALRDADDLYRRLASLGSKPSGFSFGSVRMQQGVVYKRRPGALVLESPPPSTRGILREWQRLRRI